MPTRAQRQVRQYGGGSFDFSTQNPIGDRTWRILLVGSSGKLMLIPVGSLAQSTVVVPQTVFSDSVVHARVVQQG